MGHTISSRTVKLRTARGCHWCRDEMERGDVAFSWAMKDDADVQCLHRCWAHPLCALLESNEGGYGEQPSEPERDFMVCWLHWFDTLRQLDRAFDGYPTEWYAGDDPERLREMWRRDVWEPARVGWLLGLGIEQSAIDAEAEALAACRQGLTTSAGGR